METTILIPARIRNTRESNYLVQAINSAVLQNCPIIVGLNQCEIDTKNVEKGYVTSQVNFLDIAATNLAMARNILTKLVTTKYFIFLDADDLLSENAISFAEVAHPGKGWYVYGKTKLFSENSSHIYPAMEFDPCELLGQVYFPNGVLQLTENLVATGYWDENLDVLEDKEFWIRAARVGVCGKPIQTVMYEYRSNPTGMVASARETSKWKDATAYIHQKHMDLYEGETQMACSGCGRRKAAQTLTTRVSDNNLVAGVGETAIRYNLKTGKTTFFGVNTGTAYVVSAQKNIVLVNNSDLETGTRSRPGLLEMIKNGVQLFTLA